MEMEREKRRKPTAVFMAFGTKGDVHPIAAIAAAFACDQKQYHVIFITHSAHENLSVHLVAKNVSYLPVSSPPVVSPYEDKDNAGSLELSFSLQKRIITIEHRQECLSIVERIFGDGPSLEGDFIVINFFALEGWSLAELFHVRCVVAAPYVVPYSAPSSFERHFRKELPLLYEYLQEAPGDKVCWKDVIHWMWPLFTEDWGSWRSGDLNLSPLPFTDPVTGLPMWHDRSPSPLLLYGFSKDVVECPGYWPSNVRVCGFWFLPMEWQFSCSECRETSALISSGHLNTKNEMCSAHSELQSFLKTPTSKPPVFIGLSSIGSMGFFRNPRAFLRVLQSVLEITSYRFILFSSGYEPLNEEVQAIFVEASSSLDQKQFSQDGVSLFSGRLFCFSGTVQLAVSKMCGCSSSWGQWIHCCSTTCRNPTDKNDDSSVSEAASALSRAINYALSSKVKARASEIAERISLEDGVVQAVKILKEELSCPNSSKRHCNCCNYATDVHGASPLRDHSCTHVQSWR